MKAETFYNIVNDKGQVLAGNYSASEFEVAKGVMVELANKYPNQRISLMKRLCSVTAGLTWEDSVDYMGR